MKFRIVASILLAAVVCVLPIAAQQAPAQGGLRRPDIHWVPTPPAVVDALFRGALWRDGDVAVHFAAMLMFLHGMAGEPFDWEQRPFFLRFNTTDRREREAVFTELCEKVGVDPKEYGG